jgi:hypothetical protein
MKFDALNEKGNKRGILIPKNFKTSIKRINSIARRQEEFQHEDSIQITDGPVSPLNSAVSPINSFEKTSPLKSRIIAPDLIRGQNIPIPENFVKNSES